MQLNFIIRKNKQLKNSPLSVLSGYYMSPSGLLKVVEDDAGMHSIDFVEDILDQKSGMPQSLNIAGTPFQIAVWQEVIKVPAGAVVTYEQLAHAIGKPKAVRAVANALAQNTIAYFIPCHRVIRKDGSLGGYKWGIESKTALLKAEKYVPTRDSARMGARPPFWTTGA